MFADQPQIRAGEGIVSSFWSVDSRVDMEDETCGDWTSIEMNDVAQT